jgi:hypothetical protein
VSEEATRSRNNARTKDRSITVANPSASREMVACLNLKTTDRNLTDQWSSYPKSSKICGI